MMIDPPNVDEIQYGSLRDDAISAIRVLDRTLSVRKGPGYTIAIGVQLDATVILESAVTTLYTWVMPFYGQTPQYVVRVAKKINKTVMKLEKQRIQEDERQVLATLPVGSRLDKFGRVI